MFTYIGLIKVTPEGREHFEKAPEYLAKIAKLEVVETETFPAEDVSIFMKALV